MSDKFEQLQLKLMFQEDVIDKLEQEICLQQQQMLTMQKQLRYLSAEIEKMKGNDEVSGIRLTSLQERPPHY